MFRPTVAITGEVVNVGQSSYSLLYHGRADTEPKYMCSINYVVKYI